MNSYLQRLLGDVAAASQGEFKPVARYYPEMDYLLYLKEDCSYRADRVDGVLTLLWHPYKDELVGLRFKGFRALFKQLRPALAEADFLPLVTFVAEALLRVGDDLVEKMEEQRKEELRKKYRMAIDFAVNAQVSKEELERIAA